MSQTADDKASKEVPSDFDKDDESIFEEANDDESTSTVDDEEGSVQVVREDIRLMNVVRAIVILILLTLAFISSETVFVIATITEEDNFRNAYADAAGKLIDAFYEHMESKLWSASTFSQDLTLSVALAVASSASASSTTAQGAGSWPFVTFQDFQLRCTAPLYLTHAEEISFLPLVMNGDVANWEEYAATQRHSSSQQAVKPRAVQGNLTDVLYYDVNRTIDDGIYAMYRGVSRDANASMGYYFPIWQRCVSSANAMYVSEGILFDEFSSESRAGALESSMSTGGSALTGFLYRDLNETDYAYYQTPRTSLVTPIYDQVQTANATETRSIVGLLDLQLRWETFFENALEDYRNPLYVVVESSLGGNFTYQVTGTQDVHFVGFGDLHNKKVDGYHVKSSDYNIFASFFRGADATTRDSSGASYKIYIFATEDFVDHYNTSLPDIYRGIVLGIFFIMVGIFVVYDCLIERRQLRVIDAAERSDAIVRSLFPSNVRDRLYENAKKKQEEAAAAKQSKEEWKISEDEAARGGLIEAPKNRLKNIMKSPVDHHSHAHSSSHGLGMEPIADLFPNTTVLFADIAGFTAWSSEREPSQVFALLESIYRVMDKAAKKMGVFKVETVGDCYVAATGIPEPQKDHAVIMVRFARTCLIRINGLTNTLESQLGPGTADLAMRFGVHSGPVTAGVLRGQKARFQLFGDTMNMAARMESSGYKNKIHLSQETANLLNAAGLQHWVAPRKDLVHLKGKGDMQTYWLLLGSSASSAASSENTSDTGELHSLTSQLTRPERKGTRKSVKAVWAGTKLEKVLGQTELDESQDRLIDWNVDVLLHLLKRVVARRQVSCGSTSQFASSAEKKIGGGLVLDEVQMVIALADFDPEVARKASQVDVKLLPEIRDELRDYVACIATGYKKNSFHNFEHASHVILSANKLLKRIMTPDEVGPNQKTTITPEDLHEHTYGIGTDPITQFAVVFSALIHDVGHTGVPNGQLAKEQPELAEKYICKSIAEQRSVDIAWELLMLPRFQNLRACIYQNKTECQRFRHLIVNSVMATDIFDKELKALRNARWDRAFHSTQEQPSSKEDAHRKATIVIEHIIQASDVSHTMQHWYIYQKWNERLFQEMYFGYLMGRSEKDPSQGWYEGELWFFDNYVIPLARKLEECGVFGVSSDEYLNYALQNRSEWERKGREVCKGMLARAEKEAKSRGLLRMEAVNEEEEGSESSSKTNNNNKTVEPENSIEDGDNSVEVSLLKQLVVPPGELGIVIEQTLSGCFVHMVEPSSSMYGKITPGDRFLAIDGIDVTNMSASVIRTLLDSKADQNRTFTLQARSN